MGVILRPMSTAAAGIAPRAKKFGQNLLPRGGVAHTVIDGFIVRAVSDKRTCIVTILELPAYLMGVYNGISGGSRYETSVGFAGEGMASDILAGGLEPPRTLTYDNFFVGQKNLGVSIGNTPPWEGTNPTSSIAHVFQSAILSAIAPTWGWSEQSLVIFRTNAGVAPAYIPLTDPPIGTTPILGDAGNDGSGSIGYIEIGADLLYGLDGGVANMGVVAGACLEWGARKGVALAEITDSDYRIIKALRYTIEDSPTAGGPLVGVLNSTVEISNTTIPDKPDNTTAVPRLQVIDGDPPGFGHNFVPWAQANTVVNGQEAAPGVIKFPIDTGMSRLWAKNAGVKGEHEGVFAVINVVAKSNENITVGAAADIVYGVSDGVVIDVQVNQYDRHLVYVVNLPAEGGITFTKLHEYHNTRYNLALDPPGTSSRNDYYSLLGINTRAGEPRMACLKHRVYSAVEPATGGLGSEPARRNTSLPIGSYSVAYSFVSPAGEETEISTPGYYIRASLTDSIFVIDTIIPDMPLHSGRSASEVSQPCCNYAPGVMAAIVSPTSQMLDISKDLYIALIDIQTGAMLDIGPVLNVGRNRMSGGWLSCVEQGSVDDDGAIKSHAVLLFTVAHYSATPGDVDGVYVTSDLGVTLGRVTNTYVHAGMHYVGSALAPARIGVSMR